MKIVYAPRFAKQYKKLPREVKVMAERKEKLFRKNPFDPMSGTHRLHSRLRDFWLFSINVRYRVIFEFDDKNLMYFLSIGDHSVYERL